MIYDLLIIGGGPGGLSTALHLIQRRAGDFSPAIMVLEKEHYPRPKLCAGGLVVDAERILQNLSLDVSEVPHVNVTRAHFDFAGSGLDIGMRENITLRIIRRVEFDFWLAQKAQSRGIEIQQGVTVSNLRVDSDGVTVITDQGDFRARVVVGADGSNGVTRKCIFPDAPLHTARVLEVITNAIANREAATLTPHCVRCSAGEQSHSLQGDCFGLHPRNDEHAPRDAYFDFFPVPQNIAGYTWDFPTQVNGQPMRCWGIYDTNLLADEKRPPLKALLADEMARHGFDLTDHELKGYPIRWYHPRNPVSVPRVLLVGDAVGADAIFGEGISMALGYGFVAAQELAAAFRNNDFSFRDYKRRLARSGLGQTLYARWVLTNIIYTLKWSWFQFLLWRILQPIVLLVAWIFVVNWSKRLK